MIAEWFNSVFAVFRTIQINDIIDILAVTFIVFNLFKLVRETRAEQLVKGRKGSHGVILWITLPEHVETVERIYDFRFIMNRRVHGGSFIFHMESVYTSGLYICLYSRRITP